MCEELCKLINIMLFIENMALKNGDLVLLQKSKSGISALETALDLYFSDPVNRIGIK